MKSTHLHQIVLDNNLFQSPRTCNTSIRQPHKNRSTFPPSEDSIYNPTPESNSFMSPKSQDTGRARINSEHAKSSCSRTVGSGMRVTCNFLPQVNPVDVEPPQSPIQKKVSWNFGKKSNSVERKQGKVVKKSKFRSFIDNTNVYFKRNGKKNSSEEAKPTHALGKSKSLTEANEIEMEIDEKDLENIRKISVNSVNAKSMKSLGRTESLNMDNVSENCGSVGTHQELSKLDINTEKVVKLPDNYINPKEVEEVIVEIEQEGEMSCKNQKKEVRQARQTKNVLRTFFAKNFSGRSTPTATGSSPETKFNRLKVIKVIEMAAMDNRKGKSVDRLGYYVKKLGIIVVLGISVYIVVPICLMLAAFHYGEWKVKTPLNFGFLGFLQGLVQIVILKALVDSQIRKKIEDMPGPKMGVKEALRYLTIDKFGPIGILVMSMGIYLIVGYCAEIEAKKINVPAIVGASLGISVLTNAVIYLFIWFLSPKLQKNSIEVLNRDLEQITRVRKGFLEVLETTRQQLKTPFDHRRKSQTAVNFNMTNDFLLSATSNTEQFPTTTLRTITYSMRQNIEETSKPEVLKFQNKENDPTKEIRKMRLRSIRTLALLVLAIIQIYIISEIAIGMHATQESAWKVILVGVIEVIGFVFGILDFVQWSRSPRLNTIKTFSVIVTAGIYRFVFLGFNSEVEIIGAVVIKYIFRLLDCYGSWRKNDVLSKCWKAKQIKDPRQDVYTPEDEKELQSIEYPKYFLQRSVLIHEVDIFFILAALVARTLQACWPDSPAINFGIYTNEMGLYVLILFGELALNVVLGVAVVVITQRSFRKKTNVVKVDAFQEAYNALDKRKWIIFSFKMFVLFLLLLMRANGYLM